MPFEKGRAKTGGRKKGIPNKNFMDPNHWLGLLDEVARAQADTDKIQIIYRALDHLFAKIPSLPASPGDSLANALKTQDLLDKLENDLEIRAENVNPQP